MTNRIPLKEVVCVRARALREEFSGGGGANENS